MKESEDAGKYQVNNDEAVQGLVIGDHAIVHQHFYGTQDKAVEASVLWVDDRPRNQVDERNAFAVLGLQMTLSASTEDALKKLRMKKYQVIISDMGRPSDPRAGYTLLEQLPKLNRTTPFIIYSRQGSFPKNKAEARKRGAYGSTDHVQELVEMVVNAMKV